MAEFWATKASSHAANALPAGFQDILIPNTIEGDIYKRNDAPVDRKLRPPRAGASDPRRPAAIWRGTIVGDYLILALSTACHLLTSTVESWPTFAGRNCLAPSSPTIPMWPCSIWVAHALPCWLHQV